MHQQSTPEATEPDRVFAFNRMELAGSLGDIGALLPLAVGMIMINGLSASGLFFSAGLFYIAAGLYFRVPTSVQPMKVISAYAIASGAPVGEILAAGLLMGLALIVIGSGGLMAFLQRIIPKEVVRGVQLATGLVLMMKGVDLILGRSEFQTAMNAAEPWLSVQSVLGAPIGLVLAVPAACAALLLINERRLPASLAVVAAGLLVGALLGNSQGGGPVFDIGLPALLPLGLPTWSDLAFALPALILPQLPMTIGNAVIANADLSQEYFGKQAHKVTPKKLCLSMAASNFLAFLFGGMPMCHGAGGLAAHYRFGSRTAGSNLIIGLILALPAVLLGDSILDVVRLMPLSVLGVLLIFSGAQLGLQIMDLKGRNEVFIVLVMAAVGLAANLAWGFGAGVALSLLLRLRKVDV